MRPLFVRDGFDQAVLDGGLTNLSLILAERIKRLGDLADKMEYSIQQLEAHGAAAEHIETQRRFQSAWPKMKTMLEQDEPTHDIQAHENFMNGLPSKGRYLETIQSIVDGTGKTYT